MRHTTLIKLFLVCLAGFLIGWLLYKNLVPNGRFEVVYRLEDNPFVSALRPAERLTEFPRVDSSVGQAVVGDPVYFDLHLPSSFESVEVAILHDNPKKQQWTLGAFTDRKSWQFVNIKPNIAPKDGKEEARAVFSTTGLDVIDRTITFIIGAPEARDSNELIIYEIKVVATKNPLNAREALIKLFNVLEKFTNYQ